MAVGSLGLGRVDWRCAAGTSTMYGTYIERRLWSSENACGFCEEHAHSCTIIKMDDLVSWLGTQFICDIFLFRSSGGSMTFLKELYKTSKYLIMTRSGLRHLQGLFSAMFCLSVVISLCHVLSTMRWSWISAWHRGFRETHSYTH